MARRIAFYLSGVFLLLIGPNQAISAQSPYPIYLPFIANNQPARSALPAPELKWAYGGCDASWCETGWYSSPAAADINGDRILEVIASAYSLFALDGETGEMLWQSESSNRTWPGVVIANIDGSGTNEIVIAESGGWVSAYRLDGTQIWARQPAGSEREIRGLLAADLENNGGPQEIVVTQAGESSTNTWVLDGSGRVRAGWPQLAPGSQTGYAWGVFNSNAAAANLTGDRRLELVIPSDVHYINAFFADGAPIPANSGLYQNKYWGQIGAWESLTTEIRGWGACDGVRAESYRANFADSPASIGDLNGDGRLEVAVTGNMYDCNAGYPPSRYTALFLFNSDRSRFNQEGFDWRAPAETAPPLSESYETIETALPNPVIADLDGDGFQEVLFPAYDGQLHAFWLDRTEHGSWPFLVTKPAGITRFASEPVVADLDNDGSAEVLFTSWTRKGSYRNGQLHILDSAGQPIHEQELPAPRSISASWGGSLAAPTLANIDRDPDYELIMQTASSGVVVYDLPGTAGARILWGTGRGNLQRTGSAAP